MTNRFLISDTHFGHENILKYESRPFANAAEMDAAIIANWNSKVGADDIVFHLGDVSFHDKFETAKIMCKLNGRKILIMGNHDGRSRNWYLDVGFSQVSSFPIIIDKFWMLSHEPLYMNAAMPYCNIHGHIHSKKMTGANYFCVSVEHTGYGVILFEDIKKGFVTPEDVEEPVCMPHRGA